MVLPVDAGVVGAALGLSVSEMRVRDILESAIGDAVADVEAYLGRVIQPRQFTEAHRWPVYGGWELTPLEEPVRSIDEAVPEVWEGQPTGYFTVTYTAGLDCLEPDKAPILRYIKAAAMNDPTVIRLWQAETSQKGQITNVSAEGQSISYAPLTAGGGGTPGSMAPGSLPTLGSLDRWRVAGRRVYQRHPTSMEPWPHASLWSPWP